MEEEGILDRENDTHIWYLHYVFLPIINQHICNWRDAWIHHLIQTEKNNMPFQLWVIGLEHARSKLDHRNIVGSYARSVYILRLCKIYLEELFIHSVFLIIVFF